MHSLAPLLLLAAAACARPPGLTPAPDPATALVKPQRLRKLTEELLGEYYLPRTLIPQYFGYDGHVPPPPADNEWLNKEIDRINRMNEEADNIGPYEKDLARMMVQDPYLVKMFGSPTIRNEESFSQEIHYSDRLPTASALIAPDLQDTGVTQHHDLQDTGVTQHHNKDENRKHAEDIQRSNFALTPLDKGYFDTYTQSNDNLAPKTLMGHHEGGDMSSSQMEQPRQIRQNPNLSKTKNLVADNLDRLRNGLSGDDSGTTEKPRSIRLLEAATADPADSIYSVAVVAAVCTALTLAIIAFAFGWYTMSKRAKAAADVDYPAYGVTGPTVDVSGDRKLAHSAHMYHYQHQKQQIIAMERNGMEQRNGSVSDPESEEENEEGDYTVYECPGFATTGDMEVKNPLFTEDPTPATPGKCELVKPQPKD